MKRIARFFIATALLAIIIVPVFAATSTYGRATAEFENMRPTRSETAWGRLVADAVRAAARADIALVNAGALKKGALPAGEVGDTQINALLAFPGDEVVTLAITGAQLRAALERAVQAYPTGSAAFLHGSGYQAEFNTQAPTNERLTLLRINGREVRDGDSIRVAMPMPLARGGSGYDTIWKVDGATKANATLATAVGSYVKSRGSVSPEANPRLAPQ